MMKRIQGTDIWTDGVIEYTRNSQGEFEVYDNTEDNWTYSNEDFVTLDEPVTLKPTQE